MTGKLFIIELQLQPGFRLEEDKRGFKFYPGWPKLVSLVLAWPKVETVHSDQVLPGPSLNVQVKLWAQFSAHKVPSLYLARLLKLTAVP